MNEPARDRRLAYALARIGLGLNIALHGLVRLGHIGAFAASLRTEFAPTILPGPLVEIAGYGIVLAEACIGVLVLLAIRLRTALVGGTLLMMLLEFGTCLRQDWGAAGIQLIYLGFYAVLLATLEYSRRPPDDAAGPP
jgi:thiosulfate dehydrogenase [quinone] large subunit